ncbi:MAG: hypothetical protein FLDDKLPJ_02323 [Phycisphaerae bacterium]|nr:hypothetical protein [Phycisphaerae bacterium]
MNRQILNLITGFAVLAAATTTASSQEWAARRGDETTQRPAAAPYGVTRSGPVSAYAPADPEESKSPEMAATLQTSSPTAFTALDWLDDLDRRVARQEAAFTRAQRVAVVLVALLGGCIAFMWVRLARFASGNPQAEVPVDSPDPTVHQGVAELASTNQSSVVDTRPLASPTPRSTRQSAIPRVQFLSGVIDRLVKGINESRRQRGGVETGYALVGKILGDGPSRVMMVSGLIDEGPSSARSGGHHQADRQYQQRELELLQLIDADAMFIGDAHLHPGSLDSCSAGDLRTDSANVRESHSQEMVFTIATVASAHRGNRSPDSLYHDGLKLDFYYLGKGSAYQYRHFRPEVVDGAVISAAAELRGFAAADPVRTRLDFENLRRLANYHMGLVQQATSDQARRPCIVMKHKTGGFTAMIAFSADPRQRPDVFVEDNAHQVMQFQPSYLNGAWTPGLVWFTPIILDIEREMSARRSVCAGKRIDSPAGGRSASVGMKESGPIGDEPWEALPL